MAVRDHPDRIEHFLAFGALQDEGLCPRPDRFGRVRRVLVGSEDDDADVGMLVPHPSGDLEPVDPRQADVDEEDVRLAGVRSGELQGLLAVGRFAHHHDAARRLEQLDEALARQGMVLGDADPDQTVRRDLPHPLGVSHRNRFLTQGPPRLSLPCGIRGREWPPPSVGGGGMSRTTRSNAIRLSVRAVGPWDYRAVADPGEVATPVREARWDEAVPRRPRAPTWRARMRRRLGRLPELPADEGNPLAPLALVA